MSSHGTPHLEYHQLATLFPLIEGDEFADLVADIRAHGLHEPIVLFEGKILDGRNRYRGCREAGVECRFETYEGDDPVGYVVSLNLRRRHLSESQRAMVAARLASLKVGDNQYSEGPSIEGASKLLNVGHASVERAKAVQRDGVMELRRAVDRGDVSVSAAADIATRPINEQDEIVARGKKEILQKAKEIRAEKAEARRTERIQKLVEISGGNTALPRHRRFPVVLADPPWHFEAGLVDPSRDIQYPTLSTQEICALPVADIVTDDAALFLWTTGSHLPEALQVLSAWGFEYRASLVWVKPSIGMGFFVRNRHELLLIGTRGSMPHPAPSARPDSVIEAPRGQHSEKPIEAYGLIEKMYPELPKIELFARGGRKAWATWGNQADCEQHKATEAA
jgi:N6-adenosine-specific RNA methylase IME4